MLCPKCGTENSRDANFCQHCGTDFEAETLSSKRPQPIGEREEREIFFARPTLLFVKLGYAVAVAFGFVLVVALYQIGVSMGVQIGGWLTVLLGLLPLIVPAIYHVRRNSIGFRLTDSKIELSKGIISQNYRSIPLRTIQDVGVSSSVLQRILGVGNVVIDNASEVGDKVVLQNIASPRRHADLLLNQLREFDRRRFIS